MFSFQYGEGALRPYFSQAHHAPVGLTADPFMPSIKSRIATASKNSAPNARLLKAGSVSLAVFAGIPLHLITTQVFSGRLTAVQPLVDKLGTFRTTKCIFLGQIVPFPVSWTVKMKKKQKETQDILSYHTQAAGCSDKARAKASGGRQPIEECGRTGL